MWLFVCLFFLFFFFKQKTAYEIYYGLVGSEMCIRGVLRMDFFLYSGLTSSTFNNSVLFQAIITKNTMTRILLKS